MNESNKDNRKIIKKSELRASEEHKKLAAFIKNIHLQLRIDCEKHGANEAWEIHTLQEEKLKNYAESMYQLATQHWAIKPKEMDPISYCRIEWIKNQCKHYFTERGMKKFDEKEKHLMRNFVQELEDLESVQIKTIIEPKICVLDVGSCYNPFRHDDLFSVTAIDIAPYSKDVIKCDFLNLKIDNQTVYSEDRGMLYEMQKESFDAVIFSLFLEYIPCPKQRFSCCEKAYQLLKSKGILLIVTPDSKHAGANTKIVNTSWKIILAQLGFMRISYEKLQHVHCMAFRKCFYKESALKCINWNKIPDDKELFFSSRIFIPQDFQNKKDQNIDYTEKTVKYSIDEIISLFNELPSEL
ncbi:S-adenosylmethionine sensor upstream of mTORC1 isoform X1 [Phymastichus coffea]|uniref:S-adenosylmethionine sensor upstream of mTORC1 isoform X1 n=1 Tax=Phymastichus coffea TaxID=108790 RepID=UPI00273C9E91|nr:S-adenosylmethionine sensor upstream of mTORC1 isoform X1 [Phymastichus coffea]